MAKTVSNEKLLETLLVYGNAERAARALGVTRNAIYKRLQDETFRAQYTTAQSAVINAVSLEMTAILSDAIGALHDVVTDDIATDSARISASNALLTHCNRYIETANILRRLDALEAANKTNENINER